MKRPGVSVFVLMGAFVVGGCGTSQQFEAVPASLDRGSVATQTVGMTARRYEFTPDTVRVPAGILLRLRITAEDGTHGFALPAFGIDERLEQGVTKQIELFTARRGEYAFSCSHLCSIGHFAMSGVLIIE